MTAINKLPSVFSSGEYPFGMELLSTVHWVVYHEDAQGVEDICSKVWNWSIYPEWNKRKKELMPKKYIIDALNKINSTTPNNRQDDRCS